MRDLSILIPSRNEEWLVRTVADVLEHRTADTEVIVILDGAWADPPLPQHEAVQVVHRKTSIGQRAATNLAARLSTARYVMKLDAHCAVAPGFDAELIRAAAELGPDVTQIPAQYNLHVYDWLCKTCGKRFDQAPHRTACDCGSAEIAKEIVWERRKRTASWVFDADLHFQYGKAGDQTADIRDVMTSLGACFFMERARFQQLGGLDEACGSWGQYGVEIACKSWLSGGRHMVNTNTWFAHFFRVGGIGFPYEIHGSDQEKAREYSRSFWRGNRWPKQVHPLSWLVEKFWPVPGWTPEQLADLKAAAPIVTAPRGVRVRLEEVPAAPPAASTPSAAPEGRPVSTPSKGVVYYSDVLPEEQLLAACRRQLRQAIGPEMPIARVTLKPIPDMGPGPAIVLPLERGPLAMFKQILAGLEALDSDVVFFCEHDVLYHPSHFAFTPPKRDAYFYNLNVWKVDAETGRAITYVTRQLSGICAYRELLLAHYRKRVERVEREGFSKRMGFEPGSHGRAERVDDVPAEDWRSRRPNIDLRHAHNLTPSRWSRDQFRSQRNCEGWTEADAVPGWGTTKGRMPEVLKGVK